MSKQSEHFDSGLRGFRNFGVVLPRRIGNQAVGDCPFCQKEGHFYVNVDNLLWDCKRCGESGNFEQFLGEVVKQYSLDDNEHNPELRRLAQEKQMWKLALKGWGIGLMDDKETFLLPIRNAEGKVINIRTYRPGGKLISTAGGRMGLFNVQELAKLPPEDEGPVYLCEGEWDTMAMREWLKRIKEKGVCVGVPGASTFKDNWVPFFEGKNVIALYDNDAAGQQGCLKAQEKLTGTVKSLEYLWWPEHFPSGFDIRDFLKPVVRLEENPNFAFDTLMKCVRANPPGVKVDGKIRKAAEAEGVERKGGIPRVNQAPLEPIDTKGLLEGYKSWLHMPNIDAITIMLGAALANTISGDPVWLFLVAPPGGSKSELLMSLAANKNVVAVSSLTPNTLISGASWADSKDPSLLPKLNEKILIVKDFTTLLTLNQTARDEIFGVLRDIYDGSTEKYYGNGIRRSYSCHFGILAGVTPVIETFNLMHTSLGERFLKFRMTGNWDRQSESPKIERAMENLGKESGMRRGLQELANRWMDGGGWERAKERIAREGGRVGMGEWWKERMVELAKYTARLRGVVERDRYNHGLVLYKPSSEIGTRLAKQLTKLGMGIALFLEKKTIDDPDIYRLIRRVALDTVPDRPEEIVRTIWELGGGERLGWVKTPEIVGKSRLPQTTVFSVLQDMTLLRYVERGADKMASTWRLSAEIAGHIVKGEIYKGLKVRGEESGKLPRIKIK